MSEKIIREEIITKYTSNDFIRIGYNIASGWGGECYDYQINREDGQIIFFCVEAGEKFSTVLIFEDLEEYNY